MITDPDKLNEAGEALGNLVGVLAAFRRAGGFDLAMDDPELHDTLTVLFTTLDREQLADLASTSIGIVYRLLDADDKLGLIEQWATIAAEWRAA